MAPSLRRPASSGPDSRLSARSRSRERAADGDALPGLGAFEDVDYLHERVSRLVKKWGRYPGCLSVCVCVSVCVSVLCVAAAGGLLRLSSTCRISLSSRMVVTGFASRTSRRVSEWKTPPSSKLFAVIS